MIICIEDTNCKHRHSGPAIPLARRDFSSISEVTGCCRIQITNRRRIFLFASVWLLTGRPSDRGSIPGRGKVFSFSLVSRPALRPTQPPVSGIPTGTRGSFPGGKLRLGCDADHSHPSSAEVKNDYELYFLSLFSPAWQQWDSFKLRYHMQTGSGVHLAAYLIVTMGFFNGDKAAGVWCWLAPPSFEIKNIGSVVSVHKYVLTLNKHSQIYA
jgi:hypothetical protein